MERCHVIQNSALLATGALLGCATPSSASRSVNTPFQAADHRYPPLTKNYHCEAELVAVLGKGWRDVIEMHIDRLPRLSVKIV